MLQQTVELCCEKLYDEADEIAYTDESSSSNLFAKHNFTFLVYKKSFY